MKSQVLFIEGYCIKHGKLACKDCAKYEKRMIKRETKKVQSKLRMQTEA